MSATPFPILTNTTKNHTHPHEDFSSAAGLEATLRQTVQGEVRFDAASRALYATDASNYRQVPIGLVVPRSIDDVIATMAACHKFGAPVLSRGGGTSLAGQCCNVAVVMDFSKYLRNIVALDPVTQMARVEPGIVLDALRFEAEKHELTFAPDPATHSRCTLGGMIGNNSCGVHALMGGKTVDNIEALDILLYDGTRMRVGKTSEAELEAIIAAGGRKGQIYAGLKSLRDRYAVLVRERFPDIPRRVSGYNLDQLLPENGFNVARALVGTEGTCVTILEATCELKPSPQHRRLVVLGFADAFIAADHVPAVLEHKPIGLEGFDGLLVDFMLRKNLVVDDVRLLPAGRGFLLCEFGADSDADVDAQVDRFVEDAGRYAEQPVIARYTEAEAARVWKVRESALGASVFVPGEKSGWEGWEDSAVPPEKLGAYLRELFGLLNAYGYRTPMYGHFGQGCVHLRISFDLKTTAGAAKYRDFIDKAADIVLKYGGSFSGEHGDGQSRACLLPKMFGPELMSAFVEFKALWDPTNRMNPGKLIDPIAVYDAIENLRIGPGYAPTPAKTWFQYPNDNGMFAEATERCVGVGACRRQDHGTMCPSYMATREEKHSTRGRARLLWEMMQGDTIPGKWDNEEIHEALDLCLSCKACKTECPVNVDMATWKAEFLAHHYEHKRHPVYHYAFGYMDKLAHAASVAPSLANLPMKFAPLASLAKSALGIAPQRTLPAFAAKNFRDTYQSTHGWRPQSKRADVLLWADTWNNYFHPQALHAAADVLGTAGYNIQVPKRHVCCGRPLYDFGFLDEAKRYLRNILTMFAAEIDAGMPVVMLEPSCATVFRDELINFFPHDERAQKLARQTIMLSEALANSPQPYVPPDLAGRRIVVHGHCHQKTQMTMKDEMKLLYATGAAVELLDSGCCGMAGPFGFEKDKFDVSQTLAERVLMPAVRAAASEDIIVTNGFSCREQISQNSNRCAVHLSEVLAGRQ
ncbi:FAD/FMN-dependent dehydrogenase [Terriglobus roseus DSM 18391]|uniref:FAD/FMN-dependent dehydrogenase n=1 Tax=Terriglobus roseus (strain DSM 18391 / NRRL B-41598 / KBS 63) TaxID=926566 RepID=I3ZED2_TERRK|nr:FAD-binding and (Fe-S)-binding domain-containing protein [Terriglobus roseus]AFL87600.1 FAD/FMN-dependent dehydrogenase [Terriglobus roseus DSM 18391]